MKLQLTFTFIGILYFTFVTSLPTSVLEDVKESELKSKKEKRARETNVGVSRSGDHFTNSPTAIKRGNGPRIENWENKETLMNLSPSLYSTDDDGQFEDDKTLLEYEKGYRYGTNKEKLDKELENAVLKSELYENVPYYNQYRYFDERNDDRKRKRRATKNLRLNNRYKREIELTPEEVLTLLSLWENEWRNAQDDYKPSWFRYESELDDNRDNEVEQDDEDWLDTPVYPHASNRINEDVVRDNPNYFYEDKRGQWGRFAENKKKRFMVARKRNDPTRELRYLNGPASSKNDFYTLSQLLASSPREVNVPLYQRLIL